MNRLVFAVADLAAELDKLGIPQSNGPHRLVLEPLLYDAVKREVENRHGKPIDDERYGGVPLGKVLICRG